MTLALTTPLQLVDWPSLGWVVLIGSLTFATMTVRARFAKIHAMGAVARVLAHVSIGYFGLGMVTFGSWSAFHAYFPVPGGTGWDGALGVVGGLAALTIGGCTLAEHALQVAALRRGEFGDETGRRAVTVEA